MSKIEDALNKAKKNKINHTPDVPAVIIDETVATPQVLSDAKLTAKSQVLSSKKISQMKQNVSYESNQLAELKIIHSDMGDNTIANTYRDIRTKLLRISKGRNFVAMVTSVTDDSSCGLTTINLGTAFSFDESKTSLLIDCNINNPQLNTMLDIGNTSGITDYLDDENIDANSIIQECGIKRLRLIPVGTKRESATEYFTSLRMRDLSAALLSRYSDRFIFVNAPPIIESADARILADLCDFVILVVPYGTASVSKIYDATLSIGKEKLIGVVFTEIPKILKF